MKWEKCKLEACDAEVESVWRLGKLKIENENLQEIVQKMERWYASKFNCMMYRKINVIG